MTQKHNGQKSSMIKSFALFLIFALFFTVFYFALFDTKREQPTNIRDIPVFSMPALPKEDGFLTSEDIKNNAPLLVNIWASWCAPCRAEHPILQTLKNKHGVKIIGINFKDNTENANEFIEKHGNPFFKIGADTDGLLTLDWGIRGVPETFVIDRDQRIIYRHQGEIKKDDVPTLLGKLQGSGLDTKK